MEDDLYDYMDDNSSHWETTFENKIEENKISNEVIKEETKFEKMLHKLETNCSSNGYCISKITNLNGDCFFEVIVHNKLSDSTLNIRHMTAALFLSFRSVTGFFKTFPDDTLESMFNDFSEDYNYNYDIMCSDLMNKGSWDKLPTHLMMMVISKCFNVKFVIIDSNHDKVLVINESDKKNPKEIGLGFLPEFHYIGIEKKINK